ncbi:Endoribonuclease L-PSP/chorismate mutase-like protein [Aspergillus pseudoustus]|uniref:Endoribonuclease L-PSP/chorismate mutase-like protein n=1 Tax=Aspergillus pseudoustus TaxID=1810923 RepID=A0ABR4JRU4_9EURO
MSHLAYFKYPGFGDWAAENFHYSQAVRIGDVIKISGQGGINPETQTFPTDISSEIKQAFSNVDLALRTAGGTGWNQVYSVRVYMLDPQDQAATAVLIQNFRDWMPNHRPLFTYIGVPKLAMPEMRIEVEVEAHLGGV